MEQVTVLDYVRVLWRGRWWILAAVVVAVGMAAWVAHSQPRIYRATATILAPREAPPQRGMLGALLGAGGREGTGISFPGISLPGATMTGNVDLFAALLGSRSLREEVLAEFTETWGPAVGSRLVSVQPNTRDKAVIGLTVEATDPKLAAALANAYFEHLDRWLQRNAEHQSKRQEALYLAQLQRAAEEVEAAEAELLKFQTEHRMLAAPGEAATKGKAEAAGDLRGAIMGLELQRELMRMRYTEQHPQMRELEKQIVELKRQYSRNLFGGAMELPPEGPGATGPRREFFVSAERMTPVQFAYLKLLRNLKVQEAFYTGALQGLHELRYVEGERPQGIEPLDPALPPGSPSRPNVPALILMAAAAGLVVAVTGLLVREWAVGALAESISRRTAPPRVARDQAV
jgi:tyrosine-protein kinase Etk/Wzc